LKEDGLEVIKMPVCPKCHSSNFYQTSNPARFKCPDCGAEFELVEFELMSPKKGKGG
jgi:transposase-like protein